MSEHAGTRRFARWAALGAIAVVSFVVVIVLSEVLLDLVVR